MINVQDIRRHCLTVVHFFSLQNKTWFYLHGREKSPKDELEEIKISTNIFAKALAEKNQVLEIYTTSIKELEECIHSMNLN